MHLKVKAYFPKSQVNNTQMPILLILSHCWPVSVSNYRFMRSLVAWRFTGRSSSCGNNSHLNVLDGFELLSRPWWYICSAWVQGSLPQAVGEGWAQRTSPPKGLYFGKFFKNFITSQSSINTSHGVTHFLFHTFLPKRCFHFSFPKQTFQLIFLVMVTFLK